MPTMLRPKVRIIATKTIDVEAVVKAIVMVVDRPMVTLMFGCP